VDTNLGKFVLICCRHGDDDDPETKLLLIKAAAAAMAACRWITTAPFFVFAFSFHTTSMDLSVTRPRQVPKFEHVPARRHIHTHIRTGHDAGMMCVWASFPTGIAAYCTYPPEKTRKSENRYVPSGYRYGSSVQSMHDGFVVRMVGGSIFAQQGRKKTTAASQRYEVDQGLVVCSSCVNGERHVYCYVHPIHSFVEPLAHCLGSSWVDGRSESFFVDRFSARKKPIQFSFLF
jgi:hypothetical protein